MNCDFCGTPIDYSGLVYKVDVQEWLLGRAVGRKFTLCSRCGESLENCGLAIDQPVAKRNTTEGEPR